MRILITLVAAAVLPALCFGQETKTQIKKVPAQYTSPASGSEMFLSYCAPCHGRSGKGDGPAASALKKAPADLTLLSQKNNGKYPALAVQHTIRGDTVTAAHGSRDMPIWGEIFRNMGGEQTSLVELRVKNLSDYIASLQVK
jgi:mono/diheme cytochrome c family protein